MNLRQKNALYSLLLLIAIILVWIWRKDQQPAEFRLEGRTMGTTYHITYFDKKGTNYQQSVDSLLVLVNRSINTYDSSSEVSRFNRSAAGIHFELPYLLPPLIKSKEVTEASSGAYDPTVMPLVNAWGFGPRKVERPDTVEIMRVKEFVGFAKLDFNSDSVWKKDPRVQLDFGGIGQGYGADVIADWLRSRGVEHFFIELGGEGVAQGKNLSQDRWWEVGILHPDALPGAEQAIAYTELVNTGYSTSGSYFNFRIVDGKKYSHTIDPANGFPVNRPLVSATVFAADCATADAWATAFMTMGHEAGQQLVAKHPELKVFFVYSSGTGYQTWMSPGLESTLRLEKSTP